MRLSIFLLFLSIIGRAQIPVVGDINTEYRDAHEKLSEFDFQDMSYIYDSYPSGEEMVLKLIPTHNETLWLLVEFTFKGDKMERCKETVPVEYFNSYRDTYGTPHKIYEQGESKYRVYKYSTHMTVIKLSLSDKFFTVEHHPI